MTSSPMFQASFPRWSEVIMRLSFAFLILGVSCMRWLEYEGFFQSLRMSALSSQHSRIEARMYFNISFQLLAQMKAIWHFRLPHCCTILLACTL